MSGLRSSLRAAALLSAVALASGFMGAPVFAPSRAAHRSATRPASLHTRVAWKQGALSLRAAAGGAGGKVIAPEGAPHILILPGFGNAQEDYINPFAGTMGLLELPQRI